LTEGRKFRVRGRVQGVWFRESTRQQAERLGITGHAVNLPDGTVEIVAFGELTALAQLESWLHEGPPMARVRSVESSPVTLSDQAPAAFSTG
jgi:acylphosphatase